MLNFIVRLLFGIILLDLAIAFAWVGLIAYMELADTYRKAFPNGLWIVNKISEVLKCWRNKL